MAKMDTVIRHLRRVMLRQDGAGWTDGQLLASFIDHKDEAAFVALVRRHGPMVFGVCRRLLHNHHDAEDAFQSTFLVLALKASSVRPRERVANWLHGVALRTAMKAKAMTAKRRGREKQVTEMPEPEAAQQDQWRDLQPLLDRELNGLPEKYRLPILLWDLQGKTIKDAAQQLGWPQGSVAGRLARGRKLLAKRLARRGVALSAGSLAAVVSHNAMSAVVPTSLMSTTIKAASLFAAGQAAATRAISAKVVALTEGVLKAMLLTKLKPVAALLLLTVLCGIAGLIYKAEAFEQPNPKAITKAAVEAPPAAKKGEKAMPEKERLKGTWKVVSAVVDGQPGAEGMVGGTWVINDTTMMWEYQVQRKDGKTGKAAIVVSFMLDETTKPKSLAVFFPPYMSLMNGLIANATAKLGVFPKDFPRIKGIYSLTNETLTVCLGDTQYDRQPTAFDSKPGSGHGLLVLKKVSSNYFPMKVYQLPGSTGPKTLKVLEAKLLVWIITKTISDAEGSIQYSPLPNHQLIICQSRDVHEKITKFLRVIFGDKEKDAEITVEDIRVTVKEK